MSSAWLALHDASEKHHRAMEAFGIAEKERARSIDAATCKADDDASDAAWNTAVSIAWDAGEAYQSAHRIFQLTLPP